MGGISPYKVVFGEPLPLPGTFFDSDSEGNVLETATTNYVRSIARRVSSFQYHPPRKSKRNFYVNPMLRIPQTTHVFVRQDARVSPLHPAYKDPYKVLLISEKFFLLDYTTHTDRVSIDLLKPAFLSLRNVLNASLSQSSSFSSSPLPTSESTQRVDAPRDNEADDYALSGSIPIYFRAAGPLRDNFGPGTQIISGPSYTKQVTFYI